MTTVYVMVEVETNGKPETVATEVARTAHLSFRDGCRGIRLVEPMGVSSLGHFRAIERVPFDAVLHDGEEPPATITGNGAPGHTRYTEKRPDGWTYCSCRGWREKNGPDSAASFARHVEEATA